MRVIAFAWMLAALGCAQVGAELAAAPVEAIIELGRAHCDDTICAQTRGQARERCLAAYQCGEVNKADEHAVNKAAELQRERENAAIRATGKKLAEERDAAPAREPRTCTGAEPTEQTPMASPDALPQRLDPAMISEAIAHVKPQVMSCRDRSPVKGQVLVSVKVAAEGCVLDVTVKSSPDLALGSCVATALQQAMFARTASGGSFRYPFLF